jgi:ribosome maturation factor RimP
MNARFVVTSQRLFMLLRKWALSRFLLLCQESTQDVRDERRQKLINVLEAAALAHGFELVDVELGGSGRARVIRVFLDKAGGIGVDDLAAANLWVDASIEDNEPYTSAYTLEVSSPGIDRPLRTLEHFARFADEEARLVTEPIDGRSRWSGTLAGVDGDIVLLATEGQIWRIPHETIRKAHVKGRIDFKGAPSNRHSSEERERTDDVI